MNKDVQVIIVEGVVESIDERVIAGDKPAISFNIKNRYGNRFTWFRCTAFGNRALFLKRIVSEGSLIYVVGKFLPGTDGNPKVREHGGRYLANYELKILHLEVKDVPD